MIRSTERPVWRCRSSSRSEMIWRLHGDIKRRGRLVGNQDFADCRPGPSRSWRAGAARPTIDGARLSIAAFRLRNAGSGQTSSMQRARAWLRPAQPLMQFKHLALTWAPTEYSGIEGAHRLLEDHGDLLAAQLAECASLAGAASRFLATIVDAAPGTGHQCPGAGWPGHSPSCPSRTRPQWPASGPP